MKTILTAIAALLLSQIAPPIQDQDYTGIHWDDSQVPALAIVGGATAPGLISYGGNDRLKIYGFDGSGTEDYAYFTVQLPHRYQVGQPMEAHVHWCRTADPGAPDRTNVVWQLVYSFQEINGTNYQSYTNHITNYVAAYNWTHQASSFGTITNTNANISAIMVGTIGRMCDNSSDTYDQDAGFLGFDLHFPVDAPGSRQVYVK